ncbi:glycosyltransferase [Gramella lutea]|uniref:Glycosyltransferase n=1 Tax=Christiangramia lutea TaxID=1607951 RepID=A0A9X2AC70_9FLAO|nr:glycosyltransferase [Christiangramia lutea]MCH4824157.1 glycosyltransferase [Christiangramia lutea]
MNKTKVYIDPTIRIKYSSFYIRGLYDVFGKENVKFSGKYFDSLKRASDPYSYDHYMAFVVINNKSLKKYVIDFADRRTIKERAYIWCDRYAKINFSTYLSDNSFHEKIISIPPGFGINLWEGFELVYNCLLNFIKCKFRPLVSLKAHILDYYLQFKRPKLEEYHSEVIHERNKPYVFLIGTLWPHENCIEGTNLYRKTFVETCESMNIDFEGGFFSNQDHPQYKLFKDLIFSERYSVKSYIEKTKESLFVFNTPAVHDCHGWKLGEYLAMGKAIISTPLSNNLPGALTHGENIHFVSNLNNLQEDISMLLSNPSYRKKLETGAKNYYLNYVVPKEVIKSITA